ncbi:hypothetical protein RB597_000218 [Gaeumannomyces tritici]
MPPFTPRRARRGGGGGGGGLGRGARSPAGPPKGLFETINSKWYCDCTPRTQAAIRTVQKEGRNKGRKFWTCAKDRRDQCDLFIWDDEARARELQAQEAAGLLQAPPSTPRFRQTRLTDDGSGGGGGGCGFTQTTAPPQTPTRQRAARVDPGAVDDTDDSSSSSSSDTDAQMARDEATPASATRSQRSSATAANTPSQASSRTLSRGPSSSRQQQQQQKEAAAPPPAKRGKKRKHDEYSDEDFEGSDMERDLAELTDSVVASLGRQCREMATAAPATPSKSSLRQHQRGGAGLPPTPVSRNALLISRSADGGGKSRKRVRLSTPTGGISSPTSSPTPRTSSSSSGGTAAVGNDNDDDDEDDDNEYRDDYDVTREVLTLLGRHKHKYKQQDRDTTARLRTDVRACLNGWALRAESVKRARDLARHGMASRDARVAELQARVAALEAERAADRRRIVEYREAAKKLLEG